MKRASVAEPPVTTPEVGVAIITHRARHHLPNILPPLLNSPLRPRVLVVNSSSDDGTVDEAQRLGAETLVVPRKEFNHGVTREMARHHLGTPIVVMLTPDAYPLDDTFLENLTAPVRKGSAAVAYGRQIARPEADLIERFGREFSYPSRSEIRSRQDRERNGSANHFCSNACAAWSNAALDRVGGFPPTLVSEETIVTARLLQEGESIAYVADAEVVHSHGHGLKEEFTRHFDIGYTRRSYAHLLRSGERDESRGWRFAKALLEYTWRESPARLPRVIAHLAAKWLGFRAGLFGPRLPTPIAARLSGQDYYWGSTHGAGKQPPGRGAA